MSRLFLPFNFLRRSPRHPPGVPYRLRIYPYTNTTLSCDTCVSTSSAPAWDGSLYRASGSVFGSFAGNTGWGWRTRAYSDVFYNTLSINGNRFGGAYIKLQGPAQYSLAIYCWKNNNIGFANLILSWFGTNENATGVYTRDGTKSCALVPDTLNVVAL